MKPRPHQQEAIAAILRGFKSHVRGQVYMPCGSGKTFVGALVVKRLRAASACVFVPSLLLARQLLDEYRKVFPTATFLAVCQSIETVDATGTAIPIDCRVSTDAAEARQFLKQSGTRIVICTYQSMRVLQRCAFDVAVFDEAHRTVGVREKPFAFALDDTNVRCARRLFMTATPRRANPDTEHEMYSMDDSDMYGPVFYELSVRAAIRRRIICDYRVVVAVVDEGVRTSLVATRVALRRAMERYGATKAFTFHSRIRAAEEFTSGAAESFRGYLATHVDGEQSVVDREGRLAAFRAADRAILSNARCLGEGIDLPAVDMIAFLSPKDSFVAVVQALGRVVRKSPNKKIGHVFLPVFYRRHVDESIEAAVHRASMSCVLHVVDMLREQDTTLISPTARAALPPNFDVFIDQDEHGAGAHPIAHHEAKQYVKTLRKLIRARLLKALRGRVMDRGAQLLALAREGVPRLTDKNLAAYLRRHRELHPTLRQIVPSWFQTPAARLKEELLVRAGNGELRPSFRTDAKTAAKFRLYILKGHRCYDATFTARLSEVAPAWLVDRRLREINERSRCKHCGAQRRANSHREGKTKIFHAFEIDLVASRTPNNSAALHIRCRGCGSAPGVRCRNLDGSVAVRAHKCRREDGIRVSAQN